MSILDRFSSASGWRVRDDLNLEFSAKKVKTCIEVKKGDHKVTGENFLAQILKEIAEDPVKSRKLLNLKNNESVKIILGKNEVEYVFTKAAKQAAVAGRIERASTAAINKPPLAKPSPGPPPAIDRSKKPKPKEPLNVRADPINRPSPPPTKQQQKAEGEKEADIWSRLQRDGVVDLD